MTILVLVLLVLELVLLLWRVRVVHEISTARLVRLILSTQIVLLLIGGVNRLRKSRRSGGVDPIVGCVITVLVLKREVQSQPIVVWLHLGHLKKLLESSGDKNNGRKILRQPHRSSRDGLRDNFKLSNNSSRSHTLASVRPR